MKITKRWLLTFLVLFMVTIFGVLVTRVQAEQQLLATSSEDVKNTIQNYFDMRYKIKTTLDLQNISEYFENPDRQTTLSTSEIDKMEIEIHNARLNHLKILQYKIYLDFGSLVIDGDPQTAIVIVTEGSDVIFEVSSPQISSLRNIQHTITLHKINVNWKIVSDIYDDYLWRFIKKTNQSKSDILGLIDNAHLQSLNQKATQSSNQSATLTTISNQYPYDRNGAVTYADQWAGDRNPNYLDFSNYGGDCTNFVSQAIKEGGGAIMAFGGTHGVGTSGWYYFNVNDRATDWNWVGDLYKGFYNFVVLEHFWNIGPEGEERSKDEVYFGDIIQFNWNDDSTWDHSVIIVDSIDMGYGNMLHLVDGHSDDMSHYPVSAIVYDQIRYIHINFLKGYHAYIPLISITGEESLNQVQSAYPAPLRSNKSITPTPQAYPAP